MKHYINYLLSLLTVFGQDGNCSPQQYNAKTQTIVSYKSDNINKMAKTSESRQDTSNVSNLKPGLIGNERITMFASNASRNTPQNQLQTVVKQQQVINNSGTVKNNVQMYENKQNVRVNRATGKNQLSQSQIYMEPVSNSNASTRPSTPRYNAPTQINTASNIKYSNNNIRNGIILNKQNNIVQNFVPIQNTKLNAFQKTRELESIGKFLDENIIKIKQLMRNNFVAIYDLIFGNYNKQLINGIAQSRYELLKLRGISNNELESHLQECKKIGENLVKLFSDYIKNCDTKVYTITDPNTIADYNKLMNFIKYVANELDTRIKKVCNI